MFTLTDYCTCVGHSEAFAAVLTLKLQKEKYYNAMDLGTKRWTRPRRKGRIISKLERVLGTKIIQYDGREQERQVTQHLG
jgi:hypothetical protein